MKKYKFTKTSYTEFNNGPFFDYGVEKNDEVHEALWEIESYLWTPTLVQELIDSIKALKEDDKFQYSIEGGHLTIIIVQSEAHFCSHFSVSGEADFIWPTSQLIDFLEQFKQFIEENQ